MKMHHKRQRSMWMIVLMMVVGLPVTTQAKITPEMLAPFPKISTWNTKTGVKVYYLRSQKKPIVSINAFFYASKVYDGKQWGLASMTRSFFPDVLTKDNPNMMSTTRLGEKDIVSFEITSLSDDKALKQVTDRYDKQFRPIFSAEKFKKTKKSQLKLLTRFESKPPTIPQQFQTRMYNGRLYAQPARGTVATVSKLTLKDVKQFYARYYNAQNMKLVIVGDVSPAKAKVMADKITRAIQPGEPAPSLKPAGFPVKMSLLTKNTPSPRLLVLLGQPVLAWNDPDFYATLLANSLFGSGLEGILLAEMRMKHKLVYSASSSIMPLQFKGPIMIGTQLAPDQADYGIRVILKTLKKYIADGPTQQALDAAKERALLTRLIAMQNFRGIVNYVYMTAKRNWTIQQAQNIPQTIMSVTPAQAKAAFAKNVNPNRLVIVVTGKNADKVAVLKEMAASAQGASQ